jgi:hypothetical protein
LVLADILAYTCISILFHIGQLLSGDSVNNSQFWERFGKHVPAATNKHAIIELLLEMGYFCVVRIDIL